MSRIRLRGALLGPGPNWALYSGCPCFGVDRHAIPGPVDRRDDLLLAVAIEVFPEQAGAVLRGPAAHVRVPRGNSVVPVPGVRHRPAADDRQAVAAVGPLGDEQVGAAVASGRRAGTSSTAPRRPACVSPASRPRPGSPACRRCPRNSGSCRRQRRRCTARGSLRGPGALLNQ